MVANFLQFGIFGIPFVSEPERKILPKLPFLPDTDIPSFKEKKRDPYFNHLIKCKDFCLVPTLKIIKIKNEKN